MTKEELQSQLSEIEKQIACLQNKKRQINAELDKLLESDIDFKVGDKVMSNLFELGEIVSVKGAPKCPIIALIHRNDTYCDDIAYFGRNGKHLGYCNDYTINKIIEK